MATQRDTPCAACHLPWRELARRTIPVGGRAIREERLCRVRTRSAWPREVRGRAVLRRERGGVCERRCRRRANREITGRGCAGLPAWPQRRGRRLLGLRAREPGGTRGLHLRELRV